MASHDGWKYVLETKKGYVKEDGSFTSEVKEALLIDFWDFGWVDDTVKIYKKLGFNDPEVILSGVEEHTVFPAYEARDGIGIGYYLLMGYDFESAFYKARSDYSSYKLYNDDNIVEYEEKLKNKVLDYYRERKSAEVLNSSDGALLLYQTNEESPKILDGTLKHFYSKIGRVFMYAIPLKNPHVEKYFDMNKEERDYYNYFQQRGLAEYFLTKFNAKKFNFGLHFDSEILDIKIINNELRIYLNDWNVWNNLKIAKGINLIIRDFYSEKEMHITRMFGSFVIIQKIDEELKAVKATPIPIKYCPLMVKLLKEVGGETAEKLLSSLDVSDKDKQSELMCELINQVVIKAGYFDTNRPLNSCEANVLFGASETISSGFKAGLLDASVIVSNNLGTIITTNDSNTQGAVKRMTGLFYTSPSDEITKTAIDAGIIPVFPYTSEINQIEGVKRAISEGYKRIAVTLAAKDNAFMEKLKEFENGDVTIYKFGLCSTGIDEKTALAMLQNADIIWSCASKYVKEYIEPNAIAQVGVKIPVYIMTLKGWELVKNHLEFMPSQNYFDDVTLCKGEETPVVLNQGKSLKLVKKKEIYKCSDCPYPCI